MPNNNGNNSYPTWKWLASILLGIVFLLIGFFVGGGFTETKTEIKEVKAAVAATCDRLTKLETNYDHIVASLERIEKKLDKK